MRSRCASRYLGENPEWQFVPEDESYILPFMQHREKMRKQRVSGRRKIRDKGGGGGGGAL